jgi:hypothetical protein
MGISGKSGHGCSVGMALSAAIVHLGPKKSRGAPEDWDEIDNAASRIAIQGARYPEEILKLSG